ncbi:MAG: type I secretion C-terminal target domain-containing protein, partial [Alphaproteobacteria bacterium]|nr:type I secretion C-terminal target domain-containing protein [Alphaproteobacteria bacterium]
GGGGGAGGVVTNWRGTALAVTETPYTITVGDGGSFTQNSGTTQSVGSNGDNSVFGAVTALGGGGGGSYTNLAPTGGGSGGGGGGVGPTTGGVGGEGRAINRQGGDENQNDSGGGTGYGNDGGTGAGPGDTASNTGGGGGGGAGAVGGNAAGQFGGTGGNGILSDISGTATYYAGGGGGGSGGTVANNAAGGLGGGGTGGSRGASGTAGVDGTGGGGGGTRSDGPDGSTASRGADGGSGTVIIRYDLGADMGVTTVAGGTGNDTLYGSDGMEVFVFSHTGAGNLDTVNNFNTSWDRLDLRDLLTGYDPATDAITDFVRITDSGGNSDVRVDITGSGSFGGGTVVATLSGVTGLTDEAALANSGMLIVA